MPKKNGGQGAQALGRSRGGFTAKIHVTVDGLGNPLRLRLTAGQASDIGQAIALVDGFSFDYLIVDRGYAAQAFFDWVEAKEMTPVIPPHASARNEKADRHYDR